jgi:hypothetical protein
MTRNSIGLPTEFGVNINNPRYRLSCVVPNGVITKVQLPGRLSGLQGSVQTTVGTGFASELQLSSWGGVFNYIERRVQK